MGEDKDQHALELYRKSIVIDLLYQGPLGSRDFTSEMSQQLKTLWQASSNPVALLLQGMDLPVKLASAGRLDSFRRSWLESGVTGGNRQVELASLELFASTFAIAQLQFDSFDWLVKALTGDDFRRAKREGQAAGFISTQLTFGPPATLDMLDHAHRLGLRMLQLTYNSMSTIGGGCTERTDAGLSNYGAAVVGRLNELGIIVDVSHCGRRTTLDACEISEQPVIASHSSAHGVFAHDRAKTDDEIRALAETGGVIGIYVVPFFLSADPRGAGLDTWLDHVGHISRLVGPEFVAIGTDWPMQLPDWVIADVFPQLTRQIGFREEHGVDEVVSLDGFSHYEDFSNFAVSLASRGYTAQEIEGILGLNFLRVFEKVCG